MTSVLLELRVKNSTSESASHVAAGHWPDSPNYCGSVKSSQPLAARRPSAGEEELLSFTGRRRRLIWTSKWSHRERAWNAAVWMWMCAAAWIPNIMSSSWCRLPALTCRRYRGDKALMLMNCMNKNRRREAHSVVASAVFSQDRPTWAEWRLVVDACCPWRHLPISQSVHALNYM